MIDGIKTGTGPSSENGQLQYETPTFVELGGVVELTNGSGEDDTADMKRYYY